MNNKLIDALFSVSSRIREIRKEMDMLAGDGSDLDDMNPSVPTPLRASTLLLAWKNERATSGLPRENRGNNGDLPLQHDVERLSARLIIRASDKGRECYMSGEPCREL